MDGSAPKFQRLLDLCINNSPDAALVRKYPRPCQTYRTPIQYLTRKDLAKMFSVSVRTIENWRAMGTIPQSFSFGGRTYWDPEEIRNKVHERPAQQMRQAQHLSKLQHSSAPARRKQVEPSRKAMPGMCGCSRT